MIHAVRQQALSRAAMKRSRMSASRSTPAKWSSSPATRAPANRRCSAARRHRAADLGQHRGQRPEPRRPAHAAPFPTCAATSGWSFRTRSCSSIAACSTTSCCRWQIVGLPRREAIRRARRRSTRSGCSAREKAHADRAFGRRTAASGDCPRRRQSPGHPAGRRADRPTSTSNRRPTSLKSFAPSIRSASPSSSPPMTRSGWRVAHRDVLRLERGRLLEGAA